MAHLNCNSYDGRNSVGTFFFFLALEKQAAVQRLFLLDEEGKLSYM